MSIGSCNILIPECNYVNIDTWVMAVFNCIAKSKLLINDLQVKLIALLSIDWTFYPLCFEKDIPPIKSVMMKIINRSNYHIRLTGNHKLMQFFGKCLGYSNDIQFANCDCNQEFKCDACFNKDNVPPIKSSKNQHRKFRRYSHSDDNEKIHDKKIKYKCQKYIDNYFFMDVKNNSIKNNHSSFERLVFSYSTHRESIISKNNAEIIIPPTSMFKGIIDGFYNNYFYNFKTNNTSTEKWALYNLTNKPHLFHLDSSFVFIDNNFIKITTNKNNSEIRTNNDESLSNKNDENSSNKNDGSSSIKNDESSSNKNDESSSIKNDYKTLYYLKNSFEIDSKEIFSVYMKFDSSSKYSLNDMPMGNYHVAK
jgi:hypothetical protein